MNPGLDSPLVHITHLAETALNDVPPAVTPDFMTVAADLKRLLALLNVPSLVSSGGGIATVWMWPYLAAETDGCAIWWTSPHRSSRGRPLRCLAFSTATGAVRLAEHYLVLAAQPPTPLRKVLR